MEFSGRIGLLHEVAETMRNGGEDRQADDLKEGFTILKTTRGRTQRSLARSVCVCV